MSNFKQGRAIEPVFISRRELSNRLDISVSTAQRLEKDKVITPIKIGGSVRYNWQEIYSNLQNKSKNGY